ncbi:MAG: hypothetical protein JOY54_12845 [Acidobacteriaceae bacterium]|nr:hypothetical protein [Acidobacteriaceae bacterium]
MLTAGFLFFLLARQQPDPQPQQVASQPEQNRVIQQVADSGRCADVAENPDSRVAPAPQIAPGPPPLLSFRYYEGKLHHRFGNSELMLDDAGH